ncbi:GerAB/ArcD/ProY family transporter [Paenibacillus sacheonensis]|uniref:GerAB/ArcD/ProY family transporter n=2 Tax=Paenibacillus sacheonensis TaxID=742054 RepID=A0A7X4YRF7_9BACL|nr:GerAB/ArcD/ProY family transporter [Paenibacillus sacheonensis]NBC70251.1 GerAB/ArcD/ProY family transporter [Paenibacillus sacheonensis]
MYFIVHLGLIFFMYPGDIIASTQDGHWIPIVLGFALHLAALSLYLKGLFNWGNNDIIALYMKAGKGYAVLFLLPLAVYFFMACITVVRCSAEIMTIVMLSSTPLWAVMLTFLLIPTYFALKGITSIFRTGVLIGMMNVPIILFFFSFSFQNIDWRYVFPMIGKASFLTEPSYLESFFVFAGGFLFLGFIQPHVAFRKRYVILAAIALLPFFIFSVYIPLLTFGQSTASTFNFPFIVSLDTISITWLMFERITVFLLLSLISFLMLFLSLSLWSTMRIVHAGIPALKPRYLLVSIPVLVYVVCLAIPSWTDIVKLFWWNTYLRFYIMAAIPLSTYFLASRSKKRMVRS